MFLIKSSRSDWEKKRSAATSESTCVSPSLGDDGKVSHVYSRGEICKMPAAGIWGKTPLLTVGSFFFFFFFNYGSLTGRLLLDPIQQQQQPMKGTSPSEPEPRGDTFFSRPPGYPGRGHQPPVQSD